MMRVVKNIQGKGNTRNNCEWRSYLWGRVISWNFKYGEEFSKWPSIRKKILSNAENERLLQWDSQKLFFWLPSRDVKEHIHEFFITTINCLRQMTYEWRRFILGSWSWSWTWGRPMGSAHLVRLEEVKLETRRICRK